MGDEKDAFNELGKIKIEPGDLGINTQNPEEGGDQFKNKKNLSKNQKDKKKKPPKNPPKDPKKNKDKKLKYAKRHLDNPIAQIIDAPITFYVTGQIPKVDFVEGDTQITMGGAIVYALDYYGKEIPDMNHPYVILGLAFLQTVSALMAVAMAKKQAKNERGGEHH